MKNDFDLVRQFKKHRAEIRNRLAKQYENTSRCQAFYSGDIIDYWIGRSSVDDRGVARRSMVQISKIKPYVNSVKGFFAQNRRKPKYSARLAADKMQEAFTQYSNGLSEYIRQNAFADQVETQQDGDMLICGYGAIDTSMTYTNGQSTNNPNGQVIMGRLDPLCVGWDPDAKDTGLTDARYVTYEQIYEIDMAIDLFQKSREDDFEMVSDSDLHESDYKFYSRGGRYNKIRENSLDWAGENSGKVKVHFYQWYEYEEFYRCDNPLLKIKVPHIYQTFLEQLEIIAATQAPEDKDLFEFKPKADILTFNGEIKAKLIEIFGKNLVIKEFRRKVYYSAVISKDHVFAKYRNPCQQGFTIKFKTGDYDSKNKIWTGMVNPMIEPTLYYNKALTEVMFILATNSKGGVYIEEDAVDDISAFEQAWAKTDAVITVTPGALAAGKIQPKRVPQSPSGYEDIITITANDIHEVTGIDKSFLGSSENKNDTALLQSRRIKQVMSTLANYADAITKYQLEHARLLLDFMRVFAENNDGQMFPIIGQNGKQNYLKISSQYMGIEYDVNITEAPQTQEEKQEYVAVLSAIADKVLNTDPQLAKLIFGISIKYLPLDQDDLQILQQAFNPPTDPQKAQMQEYMQDMGMQLQLQTSQANLAEKLAKKDAYTAKANMEMAKIPELQASAMQKKADAFEKIAKAEAVQNAAQIDKNPNIVI